MSAPDSLDDVKELLEAGWEIRWDGRTGSDYPPNYRLVEFEKDEQHDGFTPVKQLHLLAKDYEEVEKLREDGTDGGDTDESGENGSEGNGNESEDDG
ncbi:hypothetical protein [Halalkalicoccus jeotgali]|uniref:Uncharacterized protein n=1 Tax=Halalkalicoccus jeotgali (strain DSM 18796 / CECT 7217 / JCM 14584 / KCTC 4019 / B3) TaxID=795797 RepID=D8J8S8_HALJB|nr:hypothetical protein [Halalkalicoccus jeotgali]ADJ14263.1 hypothetical protein HacjB3_04360 [Halalkalicoccus jeotgali B3]ELY40525.1 hypothetical protein C497_02722 [Halalkalicoccus jeotgali B3]